MKNINHIKKQLNFQKQIIDTIKQIKHTLDDHTIDDYTIEINTIRYYREHPNILIKFKLNRSSHTPINGMFNVVFDQMHQLRLITGDLDTGKLAPIFNDICSDLLLILKQHFKNTFDLSIQHVSYFEAQHQARKALQRCEQAAFNIADADMTTDDSSVQMYRQDGQLFTYQPERFIY